jgi:hypothetical protein
MCQAEEIGGVFTKLSRGKAWVMSQSNMSTSVAPIGLEVRSVEIMPSLGNLGIWSKTDRNENAWKEAIKNP